MCSCIIGTVSHYFRKWLSHPVKGFMLGLMEFFSYFRVYARDSFLGARGKGVQGQKN